MTEMEQAISGAQELINNKFDETREGIVDAQGMNDSPGDMVALQFELSNNLNIVNTVTGVTQQATALGKAVSSKF
jgi:hypothetical protein